MLVIDWPSVIHGALIFLCGFWFRGICTEAECYCIDCNVGMITGVAYALLAQWGRFWHVVRRKAGDYYFDGHNRY